MKGGEKVGLALDLDRVGGYLGSVPIDPEQKVWRGTQVRGSTQLTIQA